MRHRKIIIILGILTLSTLSACNQNKQPETVSSTNTTKAVALEKEKVNYLQNAKPIDYTPKFNGFILTPFVQSKTSTLSWEILMIDWKTLTGSIVFENSVDVYQKQDNWYYKKNKTTLIEDIQKKWNKDALFDEMQLHFIDGFSKMKFLWKEYAFKSENLLKFWNKFSIDALILGKDVYVIQFENIKEKAERQITFDEYQAKIDKVKKEHWSDPYIMGK